MERNAIYALRTDMHYVRRKPVGYVYHSGGQYIMLCQFVDNIASCFGFQLAFE